MHPFFYLFMSEKPQSQAPESGKNVDLLSREEFMDEVWSRLLKVRQHFAFTDPEKPHNREVEVQYVKKENLTLVRDIDQGDFSAYAINELIHRIQNDQIGPEPLMELMPDGRTASLSLDTVRAMINTVLARRLNNAASFAGQRGFISSKNTFCYPDKESLQAAISDLIKSGLVTRHDIESMANSRSLLTIVKEALEDKEETVRQILIARLEKAGEILSGGKIPTKKEFNQSEVLKLKGISALLAYIHEGEDFMVALTMLIQLLKQKKIKVEKLLWNLEKDALFSDPCNIEVRFIGTMIANRLNRMALKARSAEMNGDQGARVRFIEILKRVMRSGLVTPETINSSMNSILKEFVTAAARPDSTQKVNQDSINPTITGMPSVSPESPDEISTETRQKLESADTEEMPGYMPSERAEIESNKPESDPDKPRKAIMMPAPGRVPDITPEPDAPPPNAIQSKPPKPEKREPVHPVIEHPEKPDHLLMPIAHIKIADKTFYVPLYSTAEEDREGYYIFSVGKHELCDIQIPTAEAGGFEDVHCYVRIRQNTVEINSNKGVTRVKDQKTTVKGWTELKADREFELSAGGATVEITLEAPGEISKEELSMHMGQRLNILEQARRKLIKEFMDDTDQMRHVDTLLNEIENLDSGFGINCRTPESYRQLRTRTEDPRRQYEEQQRSRWAKMRQEKTIEDIIKEQEEKYAAMLAEKRQEKIEARVKKEKCQALHVGPHEDPEKAQIAWRGWVIEMVDFEERHKANLRPMLVPSRTFGSHPACTDELMNPARETIKPKYFVKEFMAEIMKNRDNPDTLLLNWIGGQVQIKDENGIYGSPKTNPIEVRVGDTVRIGRYDLHILGNDHAFTPEALLPYAKNMVDEAVERIYEADRTTAEQDLTDHDNICRLTELKLPLIPSPHKPEGETLDEYASRWYDTEFKELWAQIEKWDPAHPTFDAKFFPTLDMLLDLSEETATFVPKFGVTEADLKREAQRRIDRYLQAGEAACPDYRYHPLNAFKRIGHLFKKGINRELQKAERREKAIADLGAVEIAKFIQEMEFFGEDEITMATTEKYADKISEILKIRKLFDRLEHEQGDPIENISELRRLCRGKKLRDVFTEEEIAIKDLNLELHLSPDEYVEKSYIAQKALFIARKTFNAAIAIAADFNRDADDPAKLDSHLKVLDTLLWMNLFPLIKLNDDIGAIRDEQEILEKIKELHEQVDYANARIEKEKEESDRIDELNKQYIEGCHEQNMQLIENAAKVRRALFEADQSVASFEKMSDLCAVVADKRIDGVAEKFSVEVQGALMTIRSKVKDATSVGGKRKSGDVAIADVVSYPFTESWADVKTAWWRQYIKTARYIAELVIEGHENAFYFSGLLQEAVEKGYLSYVDLGFEPQMLERGVNIAIEKKRKAIEEAERRKLNERWKGYLERMNSWRNEILACDDDDFDYLDEAPFFEVEGHSGMKEKLYELRGKITAQKISKCLEHVRNGDRAFYFHELAKEVAHKDLEAVKNLSAEDFDLLQYGPSK